MKPILTAFGKTVFLVVLFIIFAILALWTMPHPADSEPAHYIGGILLWEAPDTRCIYDWPELGPCI